MKHGARWTRSTIAVFTLAAISACTSYPPQIAPIPYTPGHESEFRKAIPYIELTPFHSSPLSLAMQCNLDLPDRLQRWAEDKQAENVLKLAKQMGIPFTTAVTGAPHVQFHTQLVLKRPDACVAETTAYLLVSSHDVTVVHTELASSDEFQVSYASDTLHLYMEYVSQSTIRSATKMFTYLKQDGHQE